MERAGIVTKKVIIQDVVSQCFILCLNTPTDFIMNNMPDIKLRQQTWEFCKIKNQRALAVKGHSHVLQPYSSLDN